LKACVRIFVDERAEACVTTIACGCVVLAVAAATESARTDVEKAETA
jgi:hypothetical protein